MNEPRVWPRHMDTKTAAEYLQIEHGISLAPLTMQNWRTCSPYCGPTYRSIRNRVTYTAAHLDEWVAREAKIVEAA